MTDEPKMNDNDTTDDITRAIGPELTVLERLVGRVIDTSGDNSAYEDERFVEWLEREVHGRMTLAERRENERAAKAFAMRTQQRLRAMRVGEALPSHHLKARDASVVGEIKHVADAAASSGCAPWLPDLAVAAGVGRELWDEPCDRWVELPKDVERGRYIALAVAGDSMTPYLHNGDTILVDTRTATRAAVAPDAIVVARRPEDGYVVKYVSRLSRSTLELSSFNAEYAPFTITHDRNTVVGVVTARLTRDAARSKGGNKNE